MVGHQPVSDRRFDAMMSAFGPFESAPLVAVGVSGGPDSMALLALMTAWARRVRGRVLALTVDHGLRTGSNDEARYVAGQAERMGARARILVWRHEGVGSGIQAAARDARYGLLNEACGRSACLHLLTAHTADDQAETIAMRCLAGSAPDGLAGMSACRKLPACRHLRPLLGVTKAALVKTCQERQVDFITDPSNTDRRFGRVQVRVLLAAAEREGDTADALTAQRLGRMAKALGRARFSLETAVADLLALAARPDPWIGHVILDRQRMTGLPPQVVARALGRVCAMVGGRAGPNRPAPSGLVTALLGGEDLRPTTVMGCLVRPVGRRIAPDLGVARGLLICRQPGRITDNLAVAVGETVLWDNRFVVGPAPMTGRLSPLALGKHMPAVVGGMMPYQAPGVAVAALPGLWHERRLIAAPLGVLGSAGWTKAGQQEGLNNLPVRFEPTQALGPAAFGVAAEP